MKIKEPEKYNNEVEEKIRKWKESSYMDVIRIFPNCSLSLPIMMIGFILFLAIMVYVSIQNSQYKNDIILPISVKKTYTTNYENGWKTTILSNTAFEHKIQIIEDNNNKKYLSVGSSILPLENKQTDTK